MQEIKDLLIKAIDFISITNNIVQFIVFLMAVIAIFFVFSNKYLYPIKILLKSLGIKRRYILKAIILCRKDPRKYIRIFCEYFILKSQGEYKDKNWWKDNYKEFVAFFRDSLPNDFIYEIDNCTDILCEGVSSKVDCYFNYFDQQKIRKKYDLNLKLPISFCMEIKIKQGYLSPNFLLSGLLDRYKNNWGNLVRKYVTLTCNEKDTNFYSSEIYYTFAWLLWGPSYQMKHQEGHFKLCQYAFGDECNSLNVVLNSNEKLDDLWNSITNHSNGVLCELTCRLFKAKKYIDYYREEFSPLNIYFTNKVAQESTGFLLEPTEFDIKKNYAALNYYCTAYVWIMFEAITDEDSCFQPSKAITFFEHANLANKVSYEACINSLITKCFEHFDRMFSIDNIEKKYRYCLSMNAYIESKFIDRYKTRIKQEDALSQKYKSCVILNMGCAESDVFSSFDAFFSSSYDDLSLMEVNIQDKRSVALLGEYYTSIYINSFPKNERESLDNIIDYLNKKENGWYGKNNYHVILAIDSGVTIGGLICDYFERSNCGVIEFIAIKQECQSEGIGTRLYQKAIELLRKDARNNKKNNIDYIFCEIEKADAGSNKDANKYLWFWNKMGYRKILFNYIQPALDDGKENVNCLDLIALPLNEEIKSHRGIEATAIKSFLLDYARYAMRIEEPEKNISISGMIEEIDSLKTRIIKTETII